MRRPAPGGDAGGRLRSARALSDAARASGSTGRWRSVAGALVPAAASFLVLALASQSVWEPTHDEGITWLQVFGPLDVPRWPESAPIEALYAQLEGERPRSAADVVDAMSSRHGMHPPAYYLLLHAVARVFGGGPFALRAPGCLGALATLAGVAWLARRLVPRRGGATLAALLVAVSPWFVAFANFARPYGVALGVSVCAQCAVLAIHTPGASARRRRVLRAAFGALSLLGVYLVYHYAFVLVWQLAQLAALDAAAAGRTGTAKERLRALVPAAGVALAVAVGYLPWASRLAAHLELTQGARFYFGGPIGAGGAAAAQLLSGFALAESLRTAAAPALLLALALLLVATAVPPLARLARPRAVDVAPDVSARVFWWSAPLLPAGIAAADAWHGTHTLFITKTCFALLPILVFGVARAWACARSQRVFVGGVLAWVVLFAAATTADVAHRANARSPYEAAAERIARNDDARHLVVVSSLLPGVVDPFVLTLRRAGVRDVRVAVAAGDKLAALIRETTPGARYANVTLAGFDVAATSGAAAARESFGDRAIDRAERAAANAGWRVVRPDDPPRVDREAGRATLWISPPLRAKTLDL